MSAWMSGIGLGLQAAQMEQQRNQQAQEMAFRQQQAAINNAQQDRQFAAYQTADVRDFDAMQQWRAFQQEQIRNKVAEDKAALDRELLGQQATAQVFKAIAAPDQTQMMPGIAMGEGSQNYHASAQLLPHPSETLDDNTLMNASPQALHAYVGARQNRAALQKRRQFGINQVEQARAAGMLKYVSPEQADEFANLGFYSDGTIMPDEMPIPLQKQREQQHEALAQMLATSRDAEGNYATDATMYEHYKSIPMEMAEVAFRQKRAAESAMQLAQFKAQAKGATGPTITQRLDMAKATLATAQREYLAAAGKNGKAGILAEPTQADYDLAATAKDDIDAGWWDATGPQPQEVEAAKRKVAAWEKYKAATEAIDGVRMGADADISARGILDGPNGPDATDTADPNTLTDDDRAKFAEVMRILGG